MKKRRVQVIAGIMTAGMLVMTGCGSAQTAEGETTAEPVVVEEAEPAAQAQSVDAIVTEPEAEEAEAVESAKEETTEVVESDMEVTESSLSGTVAQGQATNFKSFDELLDYYRSQGGYSYAKLYLRGYRAGSGEVYAITDKTWSDSSSPRATFYTNPTGNQVICAGSLNTGSKPMRIDNSGVIYADSTNYTYETYLISGDGKRLDHKDYAATDNEGSNGNPKCWGYFRDTVDEPKVERSISSLEFADITSNGYSIPIIVFEPLN